MFRLATGIAFAFGVTRILGVALAAASLRRASSTEVSFRVFVLTTESFGMATLVEVSFGSGALTTTFLGWATSTTGILVLVLAAASLGWAALTATFLVLALALAIFGWAASTTTFFREPSSATVSFGRAVVPAPFFEGAECARLMSSCCWGF